MFYSLDELTLTFPEKRGLIPQGRIRYILIALNFVFKTKFNAIKSLHTSQVTHQAGAYSMFCS